MYRSASSPNIRSLAIFSPPLTQHGVVLRLIEWGNLCDKPRHARLYRTYLLLSPVFMIQKKKLSTFQNWFWPRPPPPPHSTHTIFHDVLFGKELLKPEAVLRCAFFFNIINLIRFRGKQECIAHWCISRIFD